MICGHDLVVVIMRVRVVHAKKDVARIALSQFEVIAIFEVIDYRLRRSTLAEMTWQRLIRRSNR